MSKSRGAAGAKEGEWGSKGLPFLAFGRVKGSVRLAYYINTDTLESQQATMDVFTKLLAAAASKLSAGQRTRLQWNDGSVCCLMDPKGELLYCVVTSLLTYPERLAYQLLYDLQASTTQEQDLETAQEDGLMSRLEPKMKDLVKYYEDSSNFPQFALGMSRDSISSNQSAQSMAGAAPDTGRRGKMIGALVLLVIIIGAVVYYMNSRVQTVAVADAHQDVASVSAAHTVAETVREVSRKVITMAV